MKTKILGVSGKKQSGKNTSTNYILGVWIKAIGLAENFSIDKGGNLILHMGNYSKMVDIFNCPPELKEELDPYIRVYSFADQLKQKVCIDILGLSYEQCYGTDAQKNSDTHLKWEDMPGVICDKNADLYYDIEEANKRPNHFPECYNHLMVHEPGFMTAREVMQFAGTEIFRKMYNDVWVDATVRQINIDNPMMAIVCDTRFPNEVVGLQKHGGKVGRLTKDVFKGQDQHESETALDDYPLDRFDFVWDNENLNVEQQNILIHKTLSDATWIPHDINEYYSGS